MINKTNIWIWIIVSISIFGTFLRFYRLGVEGFDLDELITIMLVNNYNFQDILNIGRPSFYFISEYILVKTY